MRRTIFLLTVAALAALVFASPALAVPGDLDTTFGTDGTVDTGFGQFSPGDDLAIQPDGKVVVAGGEFLARYNADGSLDPSFDADGKVVTDLRSNIEEARGLALQGDGKIVVIREFAGQNSLGQLDFDIEVLRYNADGSLDTSFDTDGRLTTSVGPGNAFDSARDVVVQADGKIVVVGYSHDYNNDNYPSAGGNSDFALVRYNPDGSLDTSFDTDGKLTTDFGSDQDYAVALALQGDGKIVAAGSANNDAGGNADFALARYNADGSLDTSFDTDGKLITGVGAGNDAVSALQMQPDGKIVAAGFSAAVQPKIKDFALARYNPDGSLDTSFDGDGRLTTSVGSLNDDLGGLIMQPDGKIVVAGRRTLMDGDGYEYWEIVLARYNPDGSLDPLFGGDGRASGPRTNQQNVAAGLRADGKIFVSSTNTNQGQLLARFYGGEDVTPTGPVTGLTANVQTHDVSLSWIDPADGESAATRVLRSTTGFATGAIGGADQTKVYEGPATSRTDANLPEGRYYYTAFARDGNGNYSAAATVRAVVDLTPPETHILSGPSGDTNDNKPTFAFDALDNLSPQPNLLYSYRVDAGPWSDYSGATSATLGDTAGLPDGPHTFYVRANDEAGKEDASPAERTFTVDAQGPEVAITTGPSGTISAGTARFAFSSEPGATFTCKLDDDPNFAACDSPWEYTDLGNGDHAFQVLGYDASGNVGSTATHTWTIAPETTSQTVAAGDTLTSDAEGDGATASDPVETSITSPIPGTVSVEESVSVTQSSAGYSLLGQQVNIEAPASTADSPLVFVFTFDSSLVPSGEDQNTLLIFRNGVPLGTCADQSGAASPDPCVSGRSLLTDGDLKFTVLTSHASAWNFGVDEVAPTVRDVTPPNLAEKVSATTNVTATFSEAMDPAALNSETFFLVKKDTTTRVPAAVRYDTATRKATLDPGANLASGASYTATVTTGAKDAAGNRLTAQKTWTFTVADTVKPTVAKVSPAASATGVAPGTNVTATFSEAMTPATVNRTTVKLVRSGTTTAVPAAVAYNATTKTATLNPSSALVRGAKYTATVATGAKDLAGNSLSVKRTWSFTVRR